MAMEWSKDHKADTAYPDLPHCSAHPSSRNNQSMLVSPTSLSSYPWPLIANGSGDGYIEVQNQQQDQWTYNDYLQIGRQALEYRALSPYPEHLELLNPSVYSSPESGYSNQSATNDGGSSISSMSLNIPTNTELAPLPALKSPNTTGKGCNPQDMGFIPENEGELEQKPTGHYCRFCRRVFKRSYECTRHEKSHSANSPVWLCGLCDGDVVHRSVRKDHVTQHIRLRHKQSAIEPGICQQGGCAIDGHILGRVFASSADLRAHIAVYHQVIASPEGQKKDMAYVSPNSKHDSTNAETPLAKRLKPNDDAKSLTNLEHQNDYSPSPSNGCEMSIEEICDVKPADFAAISRSNEVACIEEKLNDAASPNLHDPQSCAVNQGRRNIVFTLSTGCIRLQGPSGIVSSARRIMEAALARTKRGSEESFPAKKHTGYQFENPRSPQRTPQRNKLFPLRVGEDSTWINFWRTFLLPKLPKMLTSLLGPDYSAALVRQGLSDTRSSVVIRIQSPKNHPKTCQQIKNQIVRISVEASMDLKIKTKFSEGELSLIAGALQQDESDIDEDEDEGEAYSIPHHRRWWKYVGMGASLGLRCSSQVSGTLGGYVLVDGDIYFLTTDHFLEKALRQTTLTNPLSRSTCELTSPSLYDVHDLRLSLDASIKGVEIEIREALEPHADLTPHDIREFEGFEKDLLDWHKRLLGFRQELYKPDEKFVLGEVKYRCGRPETEVWHNFKKVPRKMDWALCSINPDRRGENRHRHQDWAAFNDNFYDEEGRSPLGVGELCTQTAQPTEGSSVHYVGAGTGYQKAFINPPETLTSREYSVTCEWSLILPDRQSGIHNGDSGAWIIKDGSNKLVGMLWGEQDNLLHFTPINEIFQHIKDVLSTEDVTLPPTLPGNPPGIQHICRDEPKAVQARRYSTPFKRPQRRLLTGAVTGEPGLLDFPSSTRPPKTATPEPFLSQGNEISSPVPSLVGQDSSSSSESTTEASSPPPPEPLMLPLDGKGSESRALLKQVDDKHRLEYILDSMTLDSGARIQPSSSDLDVILPDTSVIA